LQNNQVNAVIKFMDLDIELVGANRQRTKRKYQPEKALMRTANKSTSKLVYIQQKKCFSTTHCASSLEATKATERNNAS